MGSFGVEATGIAGRDRVYGPAEGVALATAESPNPAVRKWRREVDFMMSSQSAG